MTEIIINKFDYPYFHRSNYSMNFHCTQQYRLSTARRENTKYLIWSSCGAAMESIASFCHFYGPQGKGLYECWIF
ncbi:hypothetical protein DMA11_16050 [Marinilabiliaceae bacterium JC017]|nr:hypothetical protein DMA11_16050 [Marinilabiliaceae bacterium JC017]